MQPEEQPIFESIESIGFYVAIVCVSAFVTLARAYGENNLPSYRVILSCSVSSGVVAFCCVAAMVHHGAIGTHFYFLAVAALIGFFYKEQDKIAKILLSKALKIGKVITESKESKGE